MFCLFASGNRFGSTLLNPQAIPSLVMIAWTAADICCTATKALLSMYSHLKDYYQDE